MSEGLIEDVEDNYLEYLDDTLGYCFEAWDTTPQAEILAHDQVLFASDVAGIDSDTLSHLSQWAFARRVLQDGDVEVFLKFGRLILAVDQPHPALAIDEIYLRVIDVVAGDERFTEAESLLEEFSSKFPDHTQLGLCRAVVAARQDAGQGQVAFEALIDGEEDDEVWIDIVSELVRIGRRDLALTWVAHARTRLKDTGNATALVDLQLLEQQIKRG